MGIIKHFGKVYQNGTPFEPVSTTTTGCASQNLQDDGGPGQFSITLTSNSVIIGMAYPHIPNAAASGWEGVDIYGAGRTSVITISQKTTGLTETLRIKKLDDGGHPSLEGRGDIELIQVDQPLYGGSEWKAATQASYQALYNMFANSTPEAPMIFGCTERYINE